VTDRILIVDNERNVIHALQRLFRKEGYTILTAQSGEQGLKQLEEQEVALVISDTLMEDMDGTVFLERARAVRPEAIRIILSGYTDVDAITAAVNKGSIYRFILKPWNDEELKLSVRRALEQYNLVQENKALSERVIAQNRELIELNRHLEHRIHERTRDLLIRNRMLLLSQDILEDLPIGVLGIDEEGMIVLVNRQAQEWFAPEANVAPGLYADKLFPEQIAHAVQRTLGQRKAENEERRTRDPRSCLYSSGDRTLSLRCFPLSAATHAKGIVMTIEPAKVEKK